MKCVVTGGAGFIGSHLVDRLLAQGNEVTVIDDLSGGRLEFIEQHFPDDRFSFVKMDISGDRLIKGLKGADIVYHLAANPDVRLGAEDTKVHLKQNVITTYNVLESMRVFGVKKIAFTSTSTVYGEAAVVPTPEDYGPLMPISLYGASKLACEALISSYCHTFGMESWLFRFANIIGSRSTHGVIYDFINKLKKDPSRLTILGDGRQSKSYLHVDDCVDAMLFAVERQDGPVNIFNIGSEDRLDVTSIARMVAAEMGLNDVKLEYTGGARGWAGDVPYMCLSIDRIKALGWRPKHNSEESVRLCIRSLLGQKG
ncbi:Nucleoside-diphosphate-sugar epimerase [Methanocella conradii HZ254]|uniref:Nucleoside-diphosphate-sugar epimerase n=1 Tax=Methanocella conradii (strain DSM 24694 / JCM 17849 / CGMCC 1.5162 / HZ254) TaxID=1041930 RepID=H8I9P6_METCZ|nr:NAD-dependent epimerase/dehydratase family protein [Methanocella conradii]AFD00497.1 Nucleoside-diphosphate-sugar epimerase [Methanocella conradii HZ254]MDI6896192.1 NAD-dependent epimerase/dehydratase family protein [Methanocella conradii]